MSKQSTEQRLIDRHPHHIWCVKHDDAGGDLLNHFGQSETIAVEAGQSVEVQLERTTSTSDRASEPTRIYLAERAGNGGVVLTLREAEDLRAAIGDLIRQAEVVEIPIDDPRDAVADRCPDWCLDRTHDTGHRYHVSASAGPWNWFVRRSRLRVDGDTTPRVFLNGPRDRIEVIHGDDTPYEIDPPTARSLAAALLRVADELES